MKNKWFWAALVFWVILSSSVISWALIFSPLSFDPKTLQHFETQLNGLAQEHTLWVNSGRLNRLIPLIESQYKKQGWIPMSSGMDFAPTALGISNPDIAFPDSFQIKLFDRNGITRTLGLWQSAQEDQTYGWTCDTPKAAQDFKTARKNWDFPFIPPLNALSFYEENFKNLQIAVITFPSTSRFPQLFHEICSAQSFDEKPYYQDGSKSSFILKRSGTRLLAQIAAEPNRVSISLINLNHQKEN